MTAPIAPSSTVPVVAIVGRPNVGKSSLFNRLVGKPIAIVDPTPGTTRDRLLHRVRRDGLVFDLIDTGGIGIVDEAKLEQDVYRQVERAVRAADRIILICDGRDGVAHLDREIATTLRPLKHKVVLAVNKVDHDGLEGEVHAFNALGLGAPVAISASQGIAITELLEHVCDALPGSRVADHPPATAKAARVRLALVGRRNVGKSSLTNALCDEERVIVADLPGTTRDAIDVDLDRDGARFTLIDTAGLRKKAQIDHDLEFYAACRTERAILRCDVALLVLDASDEVGMVDKKIAHFCEVEGKPTILVVNKWDIAQQAHAGRNAYLAWLKDRLPGLRYAPAVFTCALRGTHVAEVLKIALELHEENHRRAATSEINKLLELAVQRRRPRKVGPMPTKIYYGTQAETLPPTFVLFVNRTDYIEPGYSRYLENFLRERLPFPRVPIRILYKARDSRFHGQLDERRVVQGRTGADRKAHLVIPKRGSRTRYRRRGKDELTDGPDADTDPIIEG